MTISKKPYKGCRDFFPTIMKERNFIFNKMHDCAKAFSYQEYDGPLLEEVELYLAKSGEELIGEQIYDFVDKGKRHVSIRPEMTPTVARMAAQVYRETPKPFRWYSISNFMRYEKPQRGRLREFTQLNVDIFGAAEHLASFEILDQFCNLLLSFGATAEMFEIQINDRIIVDSVFNNLLKLTNDESLKLYKVIDKSKKVSTEVLDKMIREIISNEQTIINFKAYLALNSFEQLNNFIKENSLDVQESSLIKLVDLLKASSISNFINYDPTIVRGLDYYTGIVFECFDKHPDNRRAIAGGGAYANLLQIFKEGPLGGVGYGMGDVTLKDFLDVHSLLPSLEKSDTQIFVVYFEEDCQTVAFNLSNQLREQGINTELNLELIKPNKVSKLVANKKIEYVIQIGSREKEQGLIQLRNVITKETTEIQISDIDKISNTIKGTK
jgi:histidyl-tRNA synthetase